MMSTMPMATDAANGEGGELVATLLWPAAKPLGDPNTFYLKGLTLTDYRFEVPLDYTGGTPGTISVFCREVATGNINININCNSTGMSGALPYLLYLQGGPGFESPRLTEAGEFVRKLSRDHRLLLLDQRGTGNSTPVTTDTLRNMSVSERVRYLRCFRADSIIRDAELIRRSLLGPDTKWSILGQSFGGFCCVSYLSYFPWGLEKALICGGLPPVHTGNSADAVYKSLIPRSVRQMDKFYSLFPTDEKLLRDIVLHINNSTTEISLPSGSILSVRGLQAIGFSYLGLPGGFARLHYLLERAWVTERVSGEKVLSYHFKKLCDDALAFDTNPIYYLLHEAIYCNAGGPSEASNWAAERVLTSQRFNATFDAVSAANAGKKVYLTGEMCFPFMLDEVAALRPWKETALALASVSDWSPVYNTSQLAANTVPTAAVVYYNDTMVDFDLSMATAAAIKNINVWVTNEFTHAGLREGSDRVADMLNSMLAGKLTLER